MKGIMLARGKVLIRIESGEIAAQAYQAQAAYNNAKLQFDRIKTLFDERRRRRWRWTRPRSGSNPRRRV